MEHNLVSAQNRFARKNHLMTMLISFGITSLLFTGSGLILHMDSLKGIGALLVMAYILMLIWWLVHSHSREDEMPDFSPLINSFQSYWVMVGLISIFAGVAFVLAGVVMSNGWFMFPLSTLFAIVILVVLRQRITRRVIIAGNVMFIVFFFVEFLFQPDNAKSGLVNAIVIALLLAFQAGAGILLLNYTGLTKIQFYDGHIFKALQSLGTGCMLAFPPALFNIASLTGSPLTEFDRQFDQWWKAFYALQPGMLEETWARLFLLTFFYALLRPTSPQKPQRALTAALIISVFIHGLAHYPQSLSSPISAIFIALMYGIPLGLIYVKRDYESALSYHFFIDFVRFAFTASLVN